MDDSNITMELEGQSFQVLWNLLEPRTFPTSSCSLKTPHTSPLRNSSCLPTTSMTSPLLPQTPHSLRQNSALVSFSFFLLFSSIPLLPQQILLWVSILISYAFHLRFCSYCATVLQHGSLSQCSYFTSFGYLVSAHWTAISPQSLSLSWVTLFPLSAQSMHCPCIVYKTASFVSPLLSQFYAISAQFLVSKVHLETPFVRSLSSTRMALLGHCDSL